MSKSLGRGIQWQHSTSVPFTPVLLLWDGNTNQLPGPRTDSAQESSLVNSLLYSGAQHRSPLTQHLPQFFLDTHTTFLPGLAHTCVLMHPGLILMHLHSHLEQKQRVLLPLIPCPRPCQHRLLHPASTTAIIFPIEVSCKKPPTFLCNSPVVRLTSS